MSIIGLEDYKSYAGINSPNKDEKLQYVVDFVNEYIPRFCNTSFLPEVILGRKITCINGEEFVVPHAPLISVEEIRVLGEPVSVDSYIVSLEEGSVEALKRFSPERFAIEIDYTHGYSSVPADIILAGLEFTTYLSMREFSNSKSMGGESIDFGKQELIPPHIRLALSMYKVL
jgi:hypothetical protein